MEEHSIYIKRKTDGMIGRLDVQDLGDEWDLWTTIEHHFPSAWELMDEKDLLAVGEDQYDSDVDEIFDQGEDFDLCDWLRTVVVEVVEHDGFRRKTLKTFEGESRETLVDRARDWATQWIESSGVDTSELDVRIHVGDDEVWSWQEASRRWDAMHRTRGPSSYPSGTDGRSRTIWSRTRSR